MDIIDLIGFNGPTMIFFITISQLINQIPYLISFCIFHLINIKLNEWLKMFFREPRPEKIDLAQEQQKDWLTGWFYSSENAPTVNKAHIYGMPSGHAQVGAFALAFLFFTKKMTPALVIEGGLLMITLYQRWATHRHTIPQLLAGCVVGMLFAAVAYYATKEYLSWKDLRFLWHFFPFTTSLPPTSKKET